MKILPPLQHELALKSIAWDWEKRKFVSPSRSSFVWEQLGLATATCYKVTNYPEQYPDHEIPDESCSCGMYCSFKKSVVNCYLHTKSDVSVLCLVEAHGKTILYHGSEAGFLSEQMLVRAVINLKNATSIQKMAAYQAAEYFDVPRIKEDDAITAMDLWNMRLNDDWEEWYQINSEILKNLPIEMIREKVNQCP